MKVDPDLYGFLDDLKSIEPRVTGEIWDNKKGEKKRKIKKEKGREQNNRKK